MGRRGKITLLYEANFNLQLTFLLLLVIQFSRMKSEKPQSLAVLMAVLGIGVSSFSAHKMSAVSRNEARRHFPRVPWN